MKKGFTASLAGLALFGATAAMADTLSFGDYYFDNQTLGSGFSSLTDGLVGYTATGPGDFTIAIQGADWHGQFNHNVTVLYDDGLPGAVTITFADPVTSITQLSVQPKAFGAYEASLIAYDGATEVASGSYSGFNDFAGEGTIPQFSVQAPSITSIVLSATNDGQGIGVGGTPGVPEPATWAFLGLGVGLLGAIARRARASVSTGLA